MNARGFQAVGFANGAVWPAITRDADRPAAAAPPTPPDADALHKTVALETGWRAVWNPWVSHRSLAAVIDVKTGARIGMRIDARIERRRSRGPLAAGGGPVPERIRAAADLSGLEALKMVLKAHAGPSLVVAPVRFQSLRGSRPWSAMRALLDDVSPADRRRVIIEVCGFETTTLPAEIIEAQAILGPYCRLVLARIPPQSFANAAVRGARPPAVGVSASEFGDEPSRLTAGLLAFGVAARSLAPFRLAADLRDESLLPICDLAGFTHASVRTET